MGLSSSDLKELIQKIESKSGLIPEISKESLEVAHIVYSEMGLGEDSLTASLLYKTIRENSINPEIIKSEFGPSISNLCEGLVKISSIRKQKAGLQTEHFIQLILTLSSDPRAILISLASQLNKLRKFNSLKEDRKADFLNEIKSLYAPVAHRMGLYSIKTEMEEIWMKHAEPETYRKIADELNEKRKEREYFIASFIGPIKGKMKKAGIECEILGRPKTIFSIWNKMKKQGVNLDGIYDKFAIRIILENIPPEEEKDACWKTYSIVTENYRPFPKRLRDWISAPKSSGYESLHTTVQTDGGIWVEVQIRTRRMDIIAEKGHAAHWKYKDGGSGNIESWLQEMREALENPEEEKKTDVLKKSLYSKDIFIFTPADELKKLRQGSTVLDFAFSIHSQVGLTCKGAIVNGKFVSIKHKLENGDRVEIQSAKNQKPSIEWLKYLTSPTNKAKLKRALKEQENPFSDIGKDLLKAKLQQLDIEFSSNIVAKLLDYFKLDEPVELYELIGARKIDITKIKKAIDSILEKPETEKTEIKPQETLNSFTNIPEDILVIDELSSQIDFQMAKCCNPVLGDKVFGFVSVNKGVRIHKKSCPNAPDMISKYPYRIVKARWTGKNKKTSKTVRMKVIGMKDKGLFGTVINYIDEFPEARMVKFLLSRNENLFDAEIMMEVTNETCFEEILRRIIKIKGITSAIRLQ